VKVAITISTFARPAMLAELLASLAAMAVPPDGEVSVIVVDNDAAGSARAMVDAARLPWPVDYAIEPERNISLARNRGVAMAISRGAEALAFIDDDEVAAPRWLEELVRVQQETQADVVTGPVIGRCPAGAPSWMTRGELFTRDRRLPSGSPVPMAETANALVARKALLPDRIEGPFDPAFGRSGGGDSEFFLRLRAAGARIVWADGAEVYETVPASRASAGWLLRRAFREGNCGVRAERAAMGGWVVVPARLAKALARLAANAALLIVAPLRGREHVMRALRWICHSAGALAALAGYRYVEYNRVHGE
jgi:succinoglycan biosynthesis protein ExoM